MKSKLSITMDEELVEEVDEVLQEGLFRNRSHLIEYATKTMLEGKR